MKRNQILAVSLTIIAAAVTVQSAFSAQTSPPGPDVRVINTQTNPVPVSVINFPTGTNTVVVSSSTNAPLLVRQVDSMVMQPFSFSARVFGSDGEFSIEQVIYTVPTGKRLVLEYIAFDVVLPSGQSVLRTRVGDANAIPHFVGTTSLDNSIFQGSQLVKTYTDRTLLVIITRNSTAGHMEALVTATGYLADVP